jgi:hypothetical protein
LEAKRIDVLSFVKYTYLGSHNLVLAKEAVDIFDLSGVQKLAYVGQSSLQEEEKRDTLQALFAP